MDGKGEREGARGWRDLDVPGASLGGTQGGTMNMNDPGSSWLGLGHQPEEPHIISTGVPGDPNSPAEVQDAGAAPGLALADKCAEVLNSCGTLGYSRWMELLACSSNLKELGILLAWGLERHHLLFSKGCAGPSQSGHGAKTPTGLFPLPVRLPADFSTALRSAESWSSLEFSSQCWLAVACVALNAYYGCPGPFASRAEGKVHRRAIGVLKDKLERFLSSESPCESSFAQVKRELAEKRISYTGEEISMPHSVSVEQVLKSLPPKGHGGAIPVLPFLKGRTRFLVEHPLECLIPTCDRAGVPMSAKVHIIPGQELLVFKLLEERGVTTWLEEERVFSDQTGTLLNGLFGVVKPGKYTPSGAPVLRVIMNLVPANALLQVICGDIKFLPGAAMWLPLTVAAGEELYLSQGDMSAAFYLFELPSQWQQFMGFNYLVGGSEIGRDPRRRYRPVCRVLPMGWNSSVGIMQQISRELLLRDGLPRELEIHRARRVPSWFTGVLEKAANKTCWWQVYLDNFMAAEKTSCGHNQLDEKLQEAAMRAWSASGVLTADDKQVLGSQEVTELGIRFDGKRGLLGCSPERLLKTMWASIHLLQQQGGTKKELQVVLGRWVFILQFRRAGMGVLSRAWEAVELAWRRPELTNALLREVQILMCLGPLLQTDLRCEFDGEVTCSDASESGGAAAVASKLTWSGHSLCGQLSDRRNAAVERPILVISLFNGIGGSFRIYDVLGIAVMGRISVEIARDANRACRSAWPDVHELHDINDLSEEDVRQWANEYPRALEVHLWGGFPCVHLSRVRAFRKNLEGAGSDLFWKLLEVLDWVQHAFSSFAVVKFCIENVASMDEAARREISTHLRVRPIKLDPADTLPFSRPRLAWCSEELFSMEGLELWEEADYIRAYASAEPVETRQWIKPGWSWAGEAEGVRFPTFMKSIPRAAPPPFPAGLAKCDRATVTRWEASAYRFPPYQYQEKYLLHQPGHAPRLLDSSERELLLGFGPGHTSTCKSASDAKRSFTDYEDSRLSLCGDSFAISSFAIIGSQMCASLVPRMSPALIQLRLGLAPGASAHPSLPVPMTRLLAYGEDTGYHGSLQELVQRLGLTVKHTGSDVRLTTGQLMGRKTGAHGSVRAWWWQWKHLFALSWSHPAHINWLEMRMILHAILWKARIPSKINKKWLHVGDSMVCLYILSKGRTSSRVLQPLCNRIGSVQLALGVTLLHAHVGSMENPTDAASRR